MTLLSELNQGAKINAFGGHIDGVKQRTRNNLERGV